MRCHVEIQERIKSKQRFCFARHRHEEACNKRQARQSAKIADGPAGAGKTAKFVLRDEAGHDRVREHAHQLGGERRCDEACEHDQDRRKTDAGLAEPQRAEPCQKHQRQGSHPGLASAATVSGCAKEGTEDRDEKPGYGCGVTPERLSARTLLAALRDERRASRVFDDRVGEVGREKKRLHQRVVRLRRPIEQHPGGTRSERRPGDVSRQRRRSFGC